MVSLGTLFSSFWILANNSWMQVPVGQQIVSGKIVPSDWRMIIAGPVFLVRWLHMLLAAFLTTLMCVIATGAWYLLRDIHRVEARAMMHSGIGLATVLVPIQLIFGHLNGEYVVHHQPSKMAAIKARWHDEKPASEVLLAWPDAANQRNLFAITLPPPFGSLIDSDSLSAGEVGLDSIPPENRPPVLIPFFAFRIMVGMGLVMLAVSWLGQWLRFRGRLEITRWFSWCAFLAFPSGFVAVLTGWMTAEVGRQPWVVWGLLRTADAMTPTLSGPEALATLIGYVAVYTFIFAFGVRYIYGLLREGPTEAGVRLAPATGKRPMMAAGPAETATGNVVAEEVT